MPTRPMTRDQAFLLPPRLDDLVPADHPVRFVAAFLEALDPGVWHEWDMDGEGDPRGAPSFHPQLLLGVWLYGFMTRNRSSRGLERACREQVPLLWLTGCQCPDHNSLWRFYRDHRRHMRALFRRTVRTAVGMGLVDLALQAVDGTKIKANAARGRTLDRAGLERLMAQVEEAIGALEAQNVADEPCPAALPAPLASAQALRERVARALHAVQDEEGRRHANVTDPEAARVRGREGVVTGYNAQAVVSPIKAAHGGGMLITAVAVSAAAHDYDQLLPMVTQAGENTGLAAGTTVADGGYHSGQNLRDCAAKGYPVLMPEAQSKALQHPYHKDHFTYEAEADAYICPQGERLTYRGTRQRGEEPEVRVYRGQGRTCRACPAFGQCTRNRRQGREITVGPYERELRAHRAVMAREDARAQYRRRQGTVEPVFGILKEVQGARAFLTRGLEKVGAEWCLLAAAFNLRTLWRLWARGALMIA